MPLDIDANARIVAAHIRVFIQQAFSNRRGIVRHLIRTQRTQSGTSDGAIGREQVMLDRTRGRQMHVGLSNIRRRGYLRNTPT